MTLTNDDLQAIGTLIDKKLDEKLEPIKQTLNEHTQILNDHTKTLNKHSTILQSHSTILNEHGKSLKCLKTKVNRLNKTVDIVVGTYDERIVKNSREIDKIKKHVKLPLAY